MARALDPPGMISALKSHPKLTWQDGGYSYRIERSGQASTYTVTDGAHTISIPIRWAFGANSQTYVLDYGGQFYESRASYYQAIQGLDITMGHLKAPPKTLVEALGRELAGPETKACFECHATRAIADDRLQLESLTAGIQCEHCHVGSSLHLQAISQGKAEPVPPKLGRFTAEDTSNFCGQCHRSWPDVVRSRLFGQMNVRFQPYRLANSKCFDGSDRRISCTACHDPHREVVRDSTSYEAKCQACHSSGAKKCPVATTGCVGCHMPKVQLPGGHQIFTDHFIRVVKAQGPYPN